MYFDLVSIIVPVYNAADYLDRCVASIVGQTWQNIELVLVNDGSTDHSLELCLEWTRQDSRIIVISKANEGAGPSRSYGVTCASGSYLAFVDSDDWIDPEFVEVMLQAAKKQNAEIVYCDIKKVFDTETLGVTRSQVLKLNPETGERMDAKHDPEVIYQSGVWTWNKLYRTSLWKDLQISQPAHMGEDICTIFVLLIYAKGVCRVARPLYNYYQRMESSSYQDSYPGDYLNALKAAEKNCEQYRIPPKYRYYIGKIFGEVLSFVQIYFRKKPYMQNRIAEMEQKFQAMFAVPGSIGCLNCCIWGSFNLRCIVKEFLYFVPPYFGFSSLISLMSGSLDGKSFTAEINNKNDFREDAVEKDFSSLLLQKLAQKGNELDFLFLDFLEERYDIIELSPGIYCTKSEALETSEGFDPGQFRVIKSGSEEFIELWKSSCLRFIEFLGDKISAEKIVLVRMRLSERIGKTGQFAQAEEIRNTNQMLLQLEQFFEDNLPGIRRIEIADCAGYYTDPNYVHGCSPWHLNINFYQEAAKEISAAVRRFV